jgi:hypothetical protein
MPALRHEDCAAWASAPPVFQNEAGARRGDTKRSFRKEAAMLKLVMTGAALGIFYAMLVKYGSPTAALALTIGGGVVATVALGLLHDS